jgi:hypothetical protein
VEIGDEDLVYARVKGAATAARTKKILMVSADAAAITVTGPPPPPPPPPPATISDGLPGPTTKLPPPPPPPKMVSLPFPPTAIWQSEGSLLWSRRSRRLAANLGAKTAGTPAPTKTPLKKQSQGGAR